MAIPVVLVYLRGEDAAPMLAALRRWIASHNGTLSVVLLALVGFLQIQKALQVLL